MRTIHIHAHVRIHAHFPRRRNALNAKSAHTYRRHPGVGILAPPSQAKESKESRTLRVTKECGTATFAPGELG